MMRTLAGICLALGLLGVLCLFLPAQAPAPRVRPANPIQPAGTGLAGPVGSGGAGSADGFNPLAVVGQPIGLPDQAVIAALNELLGAKLPTTDPAIKERLTKLLSELFDIRQQVQQNELKALEDRLKTLKDQLADRGKKRDTIIGKQVESLLSGKEPEVSLWAPSTGGGAKWAPATVPGMSGGSSGMAPATTAGPKSAPSAGFGTIPGGTGGTGGFGSIGGMGMMTQPASGDLIRVGLPDELLGQLLQARTDRDKALILTAIETRISLLESQIKAAEAHLQKQVELHKTGVATEAGAEQARARLEQLNVLLKAHAELREQARR